MQLSLLSTIVLALTTSFTKFASASPISEPSLSVPAINETYTGLVNVADGQWIPIEQPTGLEKRTATFTAYTNSNSCRGGPSYTWPNVGSGCIEYWENGQRKPMLSYWVSKTGCGVRMYTGYGCGGSGHGPHNSQGCLYYPSFNYPYFIGFYSFGMSCP